MRRLHSDCDYAGLGGRCQKLTRKCRLLTVVLKQRSLTNIREGKQISAGVWGIRRYPLYTPNNAPFFVRCELTAKLTSSRVNFAVNL